MEETIFKSVFKSQLKTFIELKRKCGFRYKTEEKILTLFDSMCVDREESIPLITTELARVWSEKRPNEGESYRYKRCITLNQFATYLSQRDNESAMSYAPKPKKNFEPHIYNKAEIGRIFAVCDNYVHTCCKSDCILFTMPILIRFLYGTGIRIGEATALTDDDVDINHRLITIRDSKNGKQRLLPVSESLAAALSQYKQHRIRLNPQTVGEYFFQTLRGRRCKPEAIYKCHRKILYKAGIPFKGGHYGPRVHDWRHTFAVNSLVQMAESGLDIYTSLPVLSTYLGHQSIEATNNYVRITSEMYPNLVHKVDAVFTNVYPQLREDEND